MRPAFLHEAILLPMDLLLLLLVLRPKYHQLVMQYALLLISVSIPMPGIPKTQARQILGIKSTKRRFDGLPDANNSFFYARSEERDPKVTAEKKPGPARGRRTARVRRAVNFHSLQCRRC